MISSRWENLEKTLNKLVITRWRRQLLTALFSGNELAELGLEDETSILGNIYVGRVQKVVKNLNAAFVDFAEGQTGYYSMTDNPVPIRVNAAQGPLKEGDEIVVQVAKDAVKTKDPVMTSNLNFTGVYAVLTAGRHVIGFSSKIRDREWKDRVRPALEELLDGRAGIIVRTNAYGMEEKLLPEVKSLMAECQDVLDKAAFRTGKSLLYRSEPDYCRRLKGLPKGSLEEVITDDAEVYDSLARYMRRSQPEALEKLRLYQDSMLPLWKLYSLETAMEHACQKHVWLKSGGYLVIEPTEAMTVIDVNTGKYSGKKKMEETIRLINLEAAAEICRQIRLRNLSGIIIIDFIDMEAEEDRALLMEKLRTYALQDSVKTTVVDMTELNLVEMTRKKEKRPLREQLAMMETAADPSEPQLKNHNKQGD